eukprot:scaffold1156_cov131-Isochrysis_galbana.AAC.4
MVPHTDDRPKAHATGRARPADLRFGGTALCIEYTGYEGKRLEGPCPHQSSEKQVDDDNRGHRNPPVGRWALDAPGRVTGRARGSCQVCRSMKGEGDRGLGEIGESEC